MTRITQYDLLYPAVEELNAQKHPHGLWSGPESEKRAIQKKVEEALSNTDIFDEESMTETEANLFAVLKTIVCRLL